MRRVRVHLRGHPNILKRLLVQVAGCNLRAAVAAADRRGHAAERSGPGFGRILALLGYPFNRSPFRRARSRPVPAGARGFRVGELAVAHESGALPGPHRQPSTSERPANAAAGASLAAELGAASGERPVDNHGVEQLRLHGYPRLALFRRMGDLWGCLRPLYQEWLENNCWRAPECAGFSPTIDHKMLW